MSQSRQSKCNNLSTDKTCHNRQIRPTSAQMKLNTMYLSRYFTCTIKSVYLLLKTILKILDGLDPPILQSQKFPFWLKTLFLPAPNEHCPALSEWNILCPLVLSVGHLCRRFQRARWLCAGEHLLLCHQKLCYWVCWFLLLSQFQPCWTDSWLF